jgi:hypothetical protein
MVDLQKEIFKKKGPTLVFANVQHFIQLVCTIAVGSNIFLGRNEEVAGCLSKGVPSSKSH